MDGGKGLHGSRVCGIGTERAHHIKHKALIFVGGAAL